MDVVRATNRGVAVTRNVSSEPNWSFGQSFFFAGTVVTTIGMKSSNLPRVKCINDVLMNPL